MYVYKQDKNACKWITDSSSMYIFINMCVGVGVCECVYVFEYYVLVNLQCMRVPTYKCTYTSRYYLLTASMSLNMIERVFF